MRTFAKQYTLDIVPGESFAQENDTIILSKVNSCIIRSVQLIPLDIANGASDLFVYGSLFGQLFVPLNSTVADSETVVRNGIINNTHRLAMGESNLPCEIFIPANQSLILTTVYRLLTIDAVNSHVIYVGAVINYDLITK